MWGLKKIIFLINFLCFCCPEMKERCLKNNKSLAQEYENQFQKGRATEAVLDDLIQEKANTRPFWSNYFSKRNLKHRNHLFTFFYRCQVPTDSKQSEQAIRNVKVKLKASSMFNLKKMRRLCHYMFFNRYMQEKSTVNH